MIGICGFLRLDGGLAQGQLLEPMQRALARSGTPSFASHAEGPLAMGAAGWHATLPVAAGPALYRHPGSGCVVVADARLQDRGGLARDVALPMTPGVTDTQLIAHAWLKHGEGCAERLDGDFAFVVWDPRTRTLHCARDITGDRPLYVHHAPGRLFAFASSTPGLLALPGVPRALNEARIADFLVEQLEGYDHRVTFHQHIERLPPAHQRTLVAATSRERRYWRLGEEPLPGMPRTDAGWEDAFASTLEAVVADHLVDSQAVGCMLSGGLDSSSLAVIAADQLRKAGRAPLPTFSTMDTRSDNPETRAILAVLALPGFVPHCLDRATPDAMNDRLWRLMWQAEEPYDGIMTVLNTQYFMAADSGVEAVLDGVDGDSLLLAGNGHARLLRRGHLLHVWRNAQAIPGLIGSAVPGRRYFAVWLRKALTPDPLRRVRRRTRPATRRDLPPGGLISADFAACVDLPGRLERLAAWHASMPHWNRHRDARETCEHPYFTVGVERYRRAAAAVGVDPRHPFNDRRLLTLCSQLPDHLRMGAGQNKHLLRRIMQGRLPEAVRLRGDKKHLGWAHTQALLEAHRHELSEWMAASRTTLERFVDPDRYGRLEHALANPTTSPSPGDWKAITHAVQLGHWLIRPEVKQI